MILDRIDYTFLMIFEVVDQVIDDLQASAAGDQPDVLGAQGTGQQARIPGFASFEDAHHGVGNDDRHHADAPDREGLLGAIEEIAELRGGRCNPRHGARADCGDVFKPVDLEQGPGRGIVVPVDAGHCFERSRLLHAPDRHPVAGKDILDGADLDAESIWKW
jgi:hypothetical protein